jgi:hypothetical protein
MAQLKLAAICRVAIALSAYINERPQRSDRVDLDQAISGEDDVLCQLGNGYDDAAPSTLMNDDVGCFGGVHRHLTNRTRFWWLGAEGRSHDASSY